MFLKPCYRTKNGKRHAYWALVDSYRTAHGPRHRVVAYLGGIGEDARQSTKRAAGGVTGPSLFDAAPPTGMGLPLISAGGASLVTTAAAVALMVSVAVHRAK